MSGSGIFLPQHQNLYPMVLTGKKWICRVARWHHPLLGGGIEINDTLRITVHCHLSFAIGRTLGCPKTDMSGRVAKRGKNIRAYYSAQTVVPFCGMDIAVTCPC